MFASEGGGCEVVGTHTSSLSCSSHPRPHLHPHPIHVGFVAVAVMSHHHCYPPSPLMDISWHFHAGISLAMCVVNAAMSMESPLSSGKGRRWHRQKTHVSACLWPFLHILNMFLCYMTLEGHVEGICLTIRGWCFE